MKNLNRSVAALSALIQAAKDPKGAFIPDIGYNAQEMDAEYTKRTLARYEVQVRNMPNPNWKKTEERRLSRKRRYVYVD